ncbi:Carbamoyltransferase HypF2 [Desulfovibrionales bacterium]
MAMPNLHTPAATIAHRCLTVIGRVQGVGFRPFVYRLALKLGLMGSVQNTPAGVCIDLQGPLATLDYFYRTLTEQLPPLAVIISITATDLPLDPSIAGFHIIASALGEEHQVLISPDVATCHDCLDELFSPGDRRFLYPFINCTNCGPRYTITRSVPYDRPVTSVSCFPLCPECRYEYEDPLSRRFHAQPNACPTCGPRIQLTDADGTLLTEGPDALRDLATALFQGIIVAIKGLGGFHLACDARNHTAVAELRHRKHRPDKPLTVLVPDLDSAHSLATVSPTVATLLGSRERPIVLCPLISNTGLSSAVTPDTDILGLMLPYTPLHYVLLYELRRLDPDVLAPALVMTSGNASGEPISLGNREALRRLYGIADLFLFHDRDIIIRVDDSVIQPLPTTTTVDPNIIPFQFLRRARGYTPTPIFLSPPPGIDDPSVLGVGPELKNTLCLTKADQAFLSQHIGNLKNLETFGFFEEITKHLVHILRVKPAAVVHDLHPDYMSSRWAKDFGHTHDLPVFALQHHVAHIYAALAEHRVTTPVLGLVLDGTGLGDDGTLWGGELFFIDPAKTEHVRLAHFAHLPLPGGETAIRQPWRIGQAALWSAGINFPDRRPWPWLHAHEATAAFLPQLLKKNLNTPLSSSCGRLFDAVASIIGLCLEITYEGQAAICLEHAQSPYRRFAPHEFGYPCPILVNKEPAVLNTHELIRHAYADWEIGTPAATISRRFHIGLVNGLVELVTNFANILKITTIACSGGTMQNLTLTTGLSHALTAHGLTPLTHHITPPNDGCIALGQVAWARLVRGRNW